MLRKIRTTLAILCFVLITLLFLDFTGTLHAWFGWLAKIQFLPALLALNLGVVALLVLATLLFGRIYCSIICPLGVMQDIIARFGSRGRKRKYRYSYSPAKNWLRYGVLALFIAALVAGIGSFVALIAPYSAYGRIAQNLLAPLYGWGNNLLAYLAERADSYAFYRTEVWIRSLTTLLIAAATLILLVVLAWRNGRTWCNTVCPVGTVLGFFSRFSLFRPVIDTAKCNACGLCARQCKASCITMRSTIRAAWPAWTASTTANRAPSATGAARSGCIPPRRRSPQPRRSTPRAVRSSQEREYCWARASSAPRRRRWTAAWP